MSALAPTELFTPKDNKQKYHSNKYFDQFKTQ